MNKPTRSFFLVHDGGEVDLCRPDADFDGIGSVMAYAVDEHEALLLARAYDAGQIAPGNIAYNGKTVVALSSRSYE